MPALALATLAVLFAPSTFKCTGTAGSPDELLSRARVALGLAGTERVGTGSRPGCVAIEVRTAGTARLVELVLRGVQVPADAVEIQVNERPVAVGR